MEFQKGKNSFHSLNMLRTVREKQQQQQQQQLEDEENTVKHEAVFN